MLSIQARLGKTKAKGAGEGVGEMTKRRYRLSDDPTAKISRKQKFKDLVRQRTTVEQGLTFSQIFCEVYPDIIEKYQLNSRYDLTKSDFEYGGCNVITKMEWNDEYGKVRYLRRMIKQLRNTDDEFRWLSIMPVKRNQVDKYGKKVRPYLEYRYININASKTPELLDQVNEIWSKHAKACRAGLERANQRLQAIAERLSTPEGQRENKIGIQSILAENEFIQFYLNSHDTSEVDKIISELKDEGRLPRKYITNYDDISKILEREIGNRQILSHMMRQMPDVILYDDAKREQEIRKAIKDIIASYLI